MAFGHVALHAEVGLHWMMAMAIWIAVVLRDDGCLVGVLPKRLHDAELCRRLALGVPDPAPRQLMLRHLSPPMDRDAPGRAPSLWRQSQSHR